MALVGHLLYALVYTHLKRLIIQLISCEIIWLLAIKINCQNTGSIILVMLSRPLTLYTITSLNLMLIIASKRLPAYAICRGALNNKL